MMTNPFDNEKYPVTHPECIIKGRFVGWKLDIDFTDTGYSLKYVIQQVGSTNVEIEIDGVYTQLTDKQYWVFEVPSATSEAWDELTVDANYRWDLVLTKTATSDDAVLQSGFLKIFQSTSDRRSHAEIMVAKIDSIIEGRADNDVDSYSIKDRSISRMSIDDLIKWRAYYVDEINRTGGTVSDGVKRPKKNTVKVGFV